LEDQTWWLGYLSFQDLRCLYTLADAVVAPTLYEASSAPVLEALSMGCPVACSTVANLPWLVDGGRAGLLFDPTDVGAIADALERLWEDQGLRHRLAAAGLERVAAFSWESFAEGYLRVYEEVATRD
jgi:glycosyltransferase involved in cell wall biosynthesis